MDNKGTMRSMWLLIGFAISFIMVFFVVIFVQDIGKTEILDRLDNYTNNSGTQLGLSTEMKNHIHSLPQEYEDTNIPYDLFFVLAFVIMYGTALYGSSTARESNLFSFFGILYIGMIGFLFVMGIINLVVDWISVNFIQGFVGFDLGTVPIINSYLNHLTITNFVLALVLLLVHKLPFPTSRDNEQDDLISSEIGRFKQ